jgi:hypothetical protein
MELPVINVVSAQATTGTTETAEKDYSQFISIGFCPPDGSPSLPPPIFVSPGF